MQKESKGSLVFVKEKERTLLRMNSMDNPPIHLEINVNDFDGYKFI